MADTGNLDTRRPFSRADAVGAGLDPKLLRGSRFRRIFRGVYVDARLAMTPELRVAAALVPFHPTTFASHASAARVHRVPLPTLPDEHVTVLERNHRRRRSDIRCHCDATTEVVTVRGIRVSGYLRMFVELAELLTLVDLVIVGDNLARRGAIAPEDLVGYCQRTTLPGAVLARQAAGHVRRRVDSPMETRLRMLIVLAGLPGPEINVTVRDREGRPIRRYDLAYRYSRTVVEYDGRVHVEREANWEKDVERREADDAVGIRRLTVTAKGIFRLPEDTLLRIAQALRERGEPGVPSRLSDAWRPHFPVRP